MGRILKKNYAAFHYYAIKKIRSLTMNVDFAGICSLNLLSQ